MPGVSMTSHSQDNRFVKAVRWCWVQFSGDHITSFMKHSKAHNFIQKDCKRSRAALVTPWAFSVGSSAIFLESSVSVN